MEWTDLYIDGTILLNQKATQLDSNGLSITVHYWGALSGHYNNKPHQHSFFEVCFIIKGEGRYIDNNNTYAISSGSLFLSRPYVKHQILSETGLDILFIGFEINKKSTTKKIQDLFSNLENTETYFANHTQNTSLVKLWTSLLIMANESNPLFDHSLTGFCYSIFGYLLKELNDNQKSKERHRRYSASSTLIYNAKLYIHDNLSEPLRLNDVANHLHISGRHLSRIFQAELGESFSSYVRKEKVRKASILLSDTDLSIKEVSEKTGFDTVHYFSSVFLAEMGLPPGKFKQRFKQLNSY
jgi:AraC-like DNA-binding protein/mannose-6-phosphate isomerase-like protein (cupin superfamily)